LRFAIGDLLMAEIAALGGEPPAEPRAKHSGSLPKTCRDAGASRTGLGGDYIALAEMSLKTFPSFSTFRWSRLRTFSASLILVLSPR